MFRNAESIAEIEQILIRFLLEKNKIEKTKTSTVSCSMFIRVLHCVHNNNNNNNQINNFLLFVSLFFTRIDCAQKIYYVDLHIDCTLAAGTEPERINRTYVVQQVNVFIRQRKDK